MDGSKHEYLTLKIYGIGAMNRREAHVLRVLKSLPDLSDLGESCISKPLRFFKFKGPRREHVCLLHRPLGMTLEDWKSGIGAVPTSLLRKCFRRLLLGLHFLHTEAKIVHTGVLAPHAPCRLFPFDSVLLDVQMKNIRMRGPKSLVLAQFENDEMEDPTPRKVTPYGDTIYKSRPLQSGLGSVQLTGFGEARFGQHENWEDVMPRTYKAPEVLLGMKWSYPVDIWAAALTVRISDFSIVTMLTVQMWDLSQDRPLLNVIGPFGRRNTTYHLARLIALLGPAPADFLNRHENTSAFWDERGVWKAQANIETHLTLEKCEIRFEDEEKASFLDLIRSMLSWIPEERPTARECLNHPWVSNEGSEDPLGWASW
jgi:serine/threonine-protein kinase SRPK3